MKKLGIMFMMMALVLPAMAQEPYKDPSGVFSFGIPESWQDLGEGQFANADNSVVLTTTIEAADTAEAAIEIVLERSYPDVVGDPLQVVEAPLNSGLWLQHIYTAENGDLVIILAQVVEDDAIVIATRGTQAAVGAEQNAVLGLLQSISISALNSIPDYIDETAYTVQDVTVGAEGWELPGELALPVGDELVPAVVLVHGSGPNDRNSNIAGIQVFRDIGLGLASEGIATLRYDKRTLVHGERLMAEMSDFTLADETIDDAIAAAEFLATVEGIDPERIYIVGHSLGATAAPRIAQSDAVAGFVSMAGSPLPLYDIFARQWVRLEEFGVASAADRDLLQAFAEEMETAESADDISQFPLGLPAAYWLDIRDTDLAELALNLGKPMLFLQGEADYQVTFEEDFAAWQDVLADADNATFISYPGLSHTFTPGEGTPDDYQAGLTVDPQVIDDLAAWILAQ